jgi:hypothetical protein
MWNMPDMSRIPTVDIVFLLSSFSGSENIDCIHQNKKALNQTLKNHWKTSVKNGLLSYFHSIMSHGIIFGGNSHLNSNFFKIIIRIITNKSKHDSCRHLYKQLQILTVPSQYIFPLLVFVAKNRDLFLSNSEIHDINTRNNYNLHLPTTNVTLVQKGVLYSGSKIYNHLPFHVKTLSNDLKHFKSKLKSFLIEHTLYGLEEFYQVTSK